jgi:hypothetical protein
MPVNLENSLNCPMSDDYPRCPGCKVYENIFGRISMRFPPEGCELHAGNFKRTNNKKMLYGGSMEEAPSDLIERAMSGDTSSSMPWDGRGPGEVGYSRGGGKPTKEWIKSHGG